MNDTKHERGSRLLNNVAAYGIGAVTMRLIWVVLVPLYTRTFSPADYGQIELVSTITSFIALVVMLGMDTAVWRFYFGADTVEQRLLVVSSGYGIAILCVSIVAITLIALAQPVAFILLGSARLSTTVAWAAISLLGATILTCCTSLLRQKFAAALFNTAAVLQLIFSIGATLLFLRVLRWGLPGVFAAQACGSIATVFFLLPALRKDIAPRLSLPIARNLLRFGLPLVPASVAAWTMSLADRLFMAHYRTHAELGLYGVANKVSAAMLLGVTAFTLAWGPFALSVSKRPDASAIYARVLRYYTVVTLTGALALTAFAPLIFRLFAPPTYQSGYIVVAPLTLSLAALGAYSIVSIGVTLANRTQRIALTQGIAALLHIGINFALIPRWGMIGAAISTLISLYVAAQLLYFESQRLHRIPYQLRPLLIVCGIALVLSGIVTRAQPTIMGFGLGEATLLRLAIPALFILICWMLGLITPSELRTVIEQDHSDDIRTIAPG